MVKSFTTLYLIQCNKNAFHDELFFLYSVLQMELYFPGLEKHHSQISVLGYLESVAIKKSLVPRKKNNLQKNQLVG